MKLPKLIAAASLVVTLIAASLFAANPPGSVELEWDQSPSPNVDYLVYIGTTSGNYSSSNNVGASLETTIGNLTRGTAYFFSLTAKFNTNAPAGAVGLESEFTNELTYTPPLGPEPPGTLRFK